MTYFTKLLYLRLKKKVFAFYIKELLRQTPNLRTLNEDRLYEYIIPRRFFFNKKSVNNGDNIVHLMFPKQPSESCILSRSYKWKSKRLVSTIVYVDRKVTDRCIGVTTQTRVTLSNWRNICHNSAKLRDTFRASRFPSSRGVIFLRNIALRRNFRISENWY